jgi:uncharacterized sulfatase
LFRQSSYYRVVRHGDRKLRALPAAHKASAVKPLYPYVAGLPVAFDKSLAEYFEADEEYIFWPD